MFKKIETFRKAVVAYVGSVAAIWAVVAGADLSSKAGFFGFLAALMPAIGTYRVPNKQKP